MTKIVNLDEINWFPVTIGMTGDLSAYEERIMWVDKAIKKGFVIAGYEVHQWEGELFAFIVLAKYPMAEIIIDDGQVYNEG